MFFTCATVWSPRGISSDRKATRLAIAVESDSKIILKIDKKSCYICLKKLIISWLTVYIVILRGSYET